MRLHPHICALAGAGRRSSPILHQLVHRRVRAKHPLVRFLEGVPQLEHCTQFPILRKTTDMLPNPSIYDAGLGHLEAKLLTFMQEQKVYSDEHRMRQPASSSKPI